MLRFEIAALDPVEQILKKFNQDIEEITVEKPPNPSVYTVTLKSGVSADKLAQDISNQDIQFNIKPHVEIVESDELYAEHPESDWSVGHYVKSSSNKEPLPKIFQEGFDAETFVHLMRNRLEFENTVSHEIIEISDDSDGLSDDKEDDEGAQAFVEDLLEITKAQSQLNDPSTIENITDSDESMSY